MANTSVEKRLQTLQQKRDALDAEIKKVQTEKARDLRKRQQQREALVGKVMYKLIETRTAFKAGVWSEDDLLSLMGQHLTKQRDRQLFGLEPLEQNKAENSQSSQRAKKTSNKTNTETVKNKPSKAQQTDSQPNATRSSKTALPTGSNQDELMNEFNL